MATRAIVGEKVGMTQVWDESNKLIPVTVLKVTSVRVVRVKTPDTDGYGAVQVTYGSQKPHRINKPEMGHFEKSGIEPGRGLVELRLDDVSSYSIGDEITVEGFEPGTKVDVTSVSKGKGFAGAMKRHNFKGQGASHGNHKHHRAPGSIGACSTPGRVFKGTRMAGRMGGEKTTTMNLQVVKADLERSLLLVKGAVPGANGSLVVVRDAVKAGKKGKA